MNLIISVQLSAMKILLVALVFSMNLLGSYQTNLGRSNKDLRTECVVANDLVCPRSDITFWLYTRSTQANPTKLDINTLDRAPWVDGPLKFLVHGYSVDKDTAINAVLRPAYFSVGDYNIISVDWSVLGPKSCYFQAVQNLPTVSKCVADFINALTKVHRFSEVHVLGHSLGAHVGAWASAHIPKLSRLTKFDAANPLFNGNNSKNGTASFIDVYHSNSEVKGQKDPSGDVDVYFNNDSLQPGCKCDISCSHLRAVQYYAESISDTRMKAFPCGGWADYIDGKCKVPKGEDLGVVGENADTKVRGNYMAFTTSRQPFLLNDHFYTNDTNFKRFNRKLENECNRSDLLQSFLSIEHI